MTKHDLYEALLARNAEYDGVSVCALMARRTVAQANGANPFSIVIPCHRVVAATGLGGYGGGLGRKQWLLDHESANRSTQK